MAYSVNWVTKIVTIPQSDLTLLGGNNYELSLVDTHYELRRLEWDFIGGLWAEQIARFYETVTLSGIPKSPSVEIINGYTFNFTGSNYNVILTDYDNNLIDVYIPSNGISILGNNSVGRQTINTGSGLDATQDSYLTKLHQAHFNRRKHDTVSKTITIYEADNVTPLHVFDAPDDLKDITPQ